MVHTKVFVGNLSFKTKREDLAAEFGAAGKVVDANIITRGPRSLGYGFVEMEDEESAQKAVQIMNKKPVDNREINVELAKPRDETREKRPRPAGRGRGRGGRGRGGRGRGGHPSGERNESEPSSATTPETSTTATTTAPAGEAKGADDKSGKTRRFRPRRNFRNNRRFSNRKDYPPRKESETSLFIANLPFSIDNAALSTLYKEYNVKSAHVVLNRNGKSKGFGFVELNSQEQQKIALEATHNKVVDGRALIVKIALTAVPPEQPKSESSSSPADSKPAKAEGEAKTEEPKKN